MNCENVINLNNYLLSSYCNYGLLMEAIYDSEWRVCEVLGPKTLKHRTAIVLIIYEGK